MVWRKQPVPQCGEDKGGCDGLQEKPCCPPPTDHRHSTVERVSSTKFLGCTSQRTSPGLPTPSLSQEGTTAPTFLHRLKRASLPPPILTNFYRGTIESVLTSCITVWYGNCCAADRKTLQRTVNTAAKIIGAPLPSILDISLHDAPAKQKVSWRTPPTPPQSLPAPTLR